MAAPYVRIFGLYDGEMAIVRLEELRDNLGRFAQGGIKVGSVLPYAYGIETGFRKDQVTVTRRAGGAYYLRDSFATVRDNVRGDIVYALEKGGAKAADTAWRDISADVVGMAKYLAPIGSDTDKRPGHPGLLRASIRSFPVGTGFQS